MTATIWLAIQENPRKKVWVILKNIFLRQNEIRLGEDLTITHLFGKISRRLALGGKKRQESFFRSFCAKKTDKREPSLRCTILLEFYKGVCYAKEERLNRLLKRPDKSIK